MFKRKWVIFKETENFRVYIPSRLFKKIERRGKKGLSTIIPNLDKIRIEVKNQEKVARLLQEFLETGGTTSAEPNTEK